MDEVLGLLGDGKNLLVFQFDFIVDHIMARKETRFLSRPFALLPRCTNCLMLCRKGAVLLPGWVGKITDDIINGLAFACQGVPQ